MTDTLDTLASHKWQTPDSYFGFDPVNDYLILSRSRDADDLTESNWCTARAMLADAAGIDAIPSQGDTTAPVYDWRASHWACGWVEYLMIRPNAPQAVLDCAADIIASLAVYLVLDEDDYCEREWDSVCSAWRDLDVRDRVDIIKRSGTRCSIFAARRDELPNDDFGALRDWLTS